MFKFLRKYNKYILAVGGTLLLITFLIPFAFQQLLPAMTRGSTTWARIGQDEGRKVTSKELAIVQRELQILQNLGPVLAQAGLGEVDRPEYWYLLVREAQDAGLIGPANLMQSEQTAQTIAALSAMSGERPEFVRETLAKVQGVMRMLQLYLDSGKYSDRRLEQRARKLFHNATVQLVVIEASEPQDRPELTEQQLQEQLDAYGDVSPGAGEMGFGYRLPDRAKVEWLVVSAESVRAMIEHSDRLNAVALRKHWRLNQDRFSAPEPGAEIPDAVREDLLNLLTAETLDEIAKYANDQLRIQRRSLASRAGYLVVPDDWQGLDLGDLAQEIQRTSGVALPEYHALGDQWLTEQDLGELAGIGQASTDKFGATPVAFPELVMAAKELGGSSTISIQEEIAGPPILGGDGSVYIFRIIDTDASRPPASVDEVRDALVADLYKKLHYEQLVDAADDIRRDAVEKGLLAAAIEHDTTVLSPANVNLAFGTDLPVVGEDREAVELIIDRAMELPQDVPLSTLPEEQRILVIPVPNRLSLLIADLTGQTPLTSDTYAFYMQNGIIQRTLQQEDMGEDDGLDRAFSYDALAARHNFRLSAPSKPADEPGGEPQDATAAY